MKLATFEGNSQCLHIVQLELGIKNQVHLYVFLGSCIGSVFNPSML